jgi:hypothetical protein
MSQITITPSSPTSPHRLLAWGAAGLFGLSLLLPAVNMDPWLRGLNVFLLSFYGIVVLGVGALSSDAAGSFPHVYLSFVTCFVGASANVLMAISFFRIILGEHISLRLTALTVILTIAAGGGLCYLGKHSFNETLSFGYFGWVGCAAFLLAASIKQPPQPQRKSASSTSIMGISSEVSPTCRLRSRAW